MTDVEPLFSQEAEQSLLGALLIAPELLDEVNLGTGDLYFLRNAYILDAMRENKLLGMANDIVTIADRLSSRGRLEEAGGMSYLLRLVGLVPSAYHLPDYIAIIQDKSYRRRMVEVASEIARAAHDFSKPMAEAVGELSGALYDVPTSGKGLVPVSEVLEDVLQDVLTAAENPREIWGLPTNFTDFDAITGGIHSGECLLIVADPGVGKTTFANDLALNLAETAPGAIFSLEMYAKNAMRRPLSSRAQVRTRKMLTGRVDEGEVERLRRVKADLSSRRILICDDILSTVELRSHIARAKRSHGIEWAVVDYLYLLRDGSGLSETERTGLISRSLKQIAKDLGIALIVIHSISKAGSQSGGLTSARGSFQIVYDFDSILQMKSDPEARELIYCEFIKGREIDVWPARFTLYRIPGFPGFSNAPRGEMTDGGRVRSRNGQYYNVDDLDF